MKQGAVWVKSSRVLGNQPHTQKRQDRMKLDSLVEIGRAFYTWPPGFGNLKMMPLHKGEAKAAHKQDWGEIRQLLLR